MHPRTLFVPAYAAQSVEALGPAIETARAIGAHLHVAAFAQSPPLPLATPYDMGGFNEPLWSQEVTRANEHVREHAGQVRLALEKAGVEGDVDASLAERAQIDNLIGLHAAHTDVTLVPDSLRDEVRHRVVNGGLFLSPAPVLLLGSKPIDLGGLKRVLIGWDGGMESGAAARAVLPWLGERTSIELVLVSPVAGHGTFGAEPGAEAAEWLARHGSGVEVVRLPDEGRPVAEIVAQHAEDVDADLVVMGGYGHSRLRERVFGGTTRWMIDEAKRPVLLAR